MVATRSARKRASGELSTRTSILSLSSSGGVKTRNHNQQHSSGTSTSSSCNTRNNSDELSSQPKIKRQKTTASQKSKKARALKPVPANVKKQQPGAGSSKTARSSRAKKIIAPVATTTTKPTKFEASTTAASASAATTKSKSSTNKKRETKKATSKRKSSSSSNSKNEQQRKKQQLRNKNNASSSSSSTTTDVETTATIAGADEPQQRTKFLRSASTRSSRSSSSSTSAAASLSLLSRSSSTKKGSTRNITGAEDIDAKDRNDPTYVTDYVDDMYEHYRYKEETTTVDRMYMGSTTDKGKSGGGGGGGGKKKQPHINETMRCILVDWLVEVHYKFKLFPETLYLTVNLLDRFLSKSKESITKRDLQLVGVTALLISSKYEEMYIPELRDLTYICDGAYTEAKILRMEEKILKTLAYNVTVPTPYTFLVRFLKAANADKLMSQIANFVLDGTLLTLEHLTCVWRPSQLAAAAVFIARRALAGGGRRTTPHSHHWSSTLIKYTLYDVKEVVPVARSILNAKKKLDRNKELLALQKKYSKTKYGKVSHYKFDPIES